MPKVHEAPGRKALKAIDIEIGRRIRAYRQRANLSQTQLGDAINISFQQLQKYEKGVNRVAPSRLELIARACNISVSAFMPSLDQQHNNSGPLPFTELQIEGAQDLLASFSKIKDKGARAALVALAKAMADDLA